MYQPMYECGVYDIDEYGPADRVYGRHQRHGRERPRRHNEEEAGRQHYEAQMANRRRREKDARRHHREAQTARRRRHEEDARPNVIRHEWRSATATRNVLGARSKKQEWLAAAMTKSVLCASRTNAIVHIIVASKR